MYYWKPQAYLLQASNKQLSLHGIAEPKVETLQNLCIGKFFVDVCGGHNKIKFINCMVYEIVVSINFIDPSKRFILPDWVTSFKSQSVQQYDGFILYGQSGYEKPRYDYLRTISSKVGPLVIARNVFGVKVENV